jgi:hypothetical protein
MPKSSMEGLKRQIAAGKYAVDSRVVAGAIVDKLALIKRAQREMEAADDEAGGETAGPSQQRGPRGQRRSKRASQRRGERSSQSNGK